MEYILEGNKMKKILTYSMASALLATCLSGCDSGPEKTNLDRQVPQAPGIIVRGQTSEDQEIFSAEQLKTITLFVRDSKTQNIINEQIRFSIDDVKALNSLQLSDNAQQPNFDKEETYEFYSSTSSYTLLINKDIPEESFPVILRAQVDVEGYFSTGTTITIGYDQDIAIANIDLVNKTNPPENVTVAKKTANINAGGLTEAIEVGGAGSIGQASGTFTINPAGALKDINGNDLEPGEITIEVAYFDPSSENAEEVFPGGLSFESDTAGGETSEGGLFFTAGLMAVDIIDSKGNKAHILGGDNAATLTFNIPTDLDNPKTGAKVKEGDIIPIWSRSEKTGQWAMEEDETTTVLKSADGQLYIKYSTGHLSYWNLDWYGSRCNVRGLTFTSLSGESFDMPPGSIRVNIDNSPINLHRRKYSRDISNKLYNSPRANTSTTFTAFYKNQQLGQTLASNCNDINIAVDTSLIPAPLPSVDLAITAAFVAPQAVNFWEVERMLREAKIDKARRNKILEFTHPGSEPAASIYSYYLNYEAYRARYQRVSLADIYQKILDQNLMDREDISIVQTVQATKYTLNDARSWYYLMDSDYRYVTSGYLQMSNVGVNLQLRTAEGDILYFGAYGRVFDTDDQSYSWVYGYNRTVLTADQLSTGKIDFELPSASAVSVIYKALINKTKVSE